MIKVFLDINVVITYLLQITKPDDPSYLDEVNDIWKAMMEAKIMGCMASFSLPIIFGHCESHYYSLSRKANWRAARHQARVAAYEDVRKCIDSLMVYDLVHAYLLNADWLIDENPSCDDFEDNLQLVSAYEAGTRLLVTDNGRDFGCAKLFNITVLTPAQLLKRL